MSRFVDVTEARQYLGAAAGELLLAQRGLREPTDMFPADDGGANGPFVMMLGALHDQLAAVLDLIEEVEPTGETETCPRCGAVFVAGPGIDRFMKHHMDACDPEPEPGE